MHPRLQREGAPGQEPQQVFQEPVPSSGPPAICLNQARPRCHVGLCLHHAGPPEHQMGERGNAQEAQFWSRSCVTRAVQTTSLVLSGRFQRIWGGALHRQHCSYPGLFCPVTAGCHPLSPTLKDSGGVPCHRIRPAGDWGRLPPPGHFICDPVPDSYLHDKRVYRTGDRGVSVGQCHRHPFPSVLHRQGKRALRRH